MNFLLHIIVLIGLTLPSALGYNLVFGKGKILHFGPVGVSIISAYASVITLLQTGSFLAAFLAGLSAATIVSLVFWYLSLRLDSDSFGVLSIAVHLSLLAVILNWNSVTRGSLGIPKIPRLPFLNDVGDFALFCSFVAAMLAWLLLRIEKSTFGRRLSALAEHEWYAGALGIEKKSTHVTAFLVAAFCAAVGNFLYPQYLTLVHPNEYQFSVLVFFVTIVVAGGPGSVKGVTISTVLLTFLKELIRLLPLSPTALGPVRLLLFGVILFAAVFWRRDSLFPQTRRI